MCLKRCLSLPTLPFYFCLMKIVPISLPTPFYIGAVNVYLIKEDPITIIDTGPKTREATDALRAALRDNGLTSGDIRRIVLTHAHEDHCGLARSLRDEAKDAEVFVHDWETGHRAARLEHEDNLRLLRAAGVPDEEIELMRGLYESVRQYADSLEDDHCTSLHDEDELEVSSGTLRVIHTPGHTAGHVLFFREADRVAVAGDILANINFISWQPGLREPPPFFSVDAAQNRASVRKLAALQPSLVCFGHGPPLHRTELLEKVVARMDAKQR